MPSAAFVEDNDHRLSILSGQPLGVGSMDVGECMLSMVHFGVPDARLFLGWLEIFLDRRVMQDDNRGLFQPVTDNKITPDHFSIVLERLSPNAAKPVSQPLFSSVTAHWTRRADFILG